MKRHIYKPFSAILLILLAFASVGLAEPLDWESLRQERAGLEERVIQARQDEQAVVAELFTLNRTLDEIRLAIERLDKAIQDVRAQQSQAEAERLRLEAQRRERKELLGRRARYYSENGTFAPIGFLLQAGSFQDFLFRIDLLQMALERDAQLIRELRELQAAVERLEAVLAAKRTELAELQHKQEAEASRLQSEVARKEQILSGLQDRRTTVEARVGEIERVWSEAAVPVLTAFGRSLQAIALKVRDLKPDQIQFSLMPPGVSVQVSEQNLNDFFRRDLDLKGLTLRLTPGQVQLEGLFSGMSLRIPGRFSIQGRAQVRYEPQEIRFQDLVLPAAVTSELLAAGRLDMDFSDLIGPWSLKDVEIQDGSVTVRAGM